MSFNVEELLKIKKASSGFFKGSTRKEISNALNSCKYVIDRIKGLDDVSRKKELTNLLNKLTSTRQQALAAGAKGYADASWASAAVCESWVAELLLGDVDSIAEAEAIIQQLMNR